MRRWQKVTPLALWINGKYNMNNRSEFDAKLKLLRWKPYLISTVMSGAHFSTNAIIDIRVLSFLLEIEIDQNREIFRLKILVPSNTS